MYHMSDLEGSFEPGCNLSGTAANSEAQTSFNPDYLESSQLIETASGVMLGMASAGTKLAKRIQQTRRLNPVRDWNWSDSQLDLFQIQMNTDRPNPYV